MNRSRRDFLKTSIYTSLAAAPVASITMSAQVLADALPAEDTEAMLAEGFPTGRNYGPDRVLRLFNVHTGERYDGPFWSQGRFVSAGLEQVSYLLRDYRIGESLPIDPMALDFMYAVYVQLNTDEPIQILSGYRSPQTNAKLAKNSGKVARNSLHMKGRAIDFRVPGHSADKLRKLALATRRGGVGYYRKSDFIHIDTGAYRSWSSESS